MFRHFFIMEYSNFIKYIKINYFSDLMTENYNLLIETRVNKPFFIFHILPLFAKNKNNIHCLLVHIKIIYMNMILLQFRINHISFFYYSSTKFKLLGI